MELYSLAILLNSFSISESMLTVQQPKVLYNVQNCGLSSALKLNGGKKSRHCGWASTSTAKQTMVIKESKSFVELVFTTAMMITIWKKEGIQV